MYTKQVNSTFCMRWFASSEVISQVLFTSKQPEKNKKAFFAIFSQKKLLFGPLVIQLVWYILKQLFTSVSVKVVDIYLTASWLGEYPPLFTSTSVNNIIVNYTSPILRSVRFPFHQIFVDLEIFCTNLESPVWSHYVGVPPRNTNMAAGK